MLPARTKMMDGNEAAASVAYRASEVIAIYPITPSSPMGELADAWSTEGLTNLWGSVPEVVEMQSEAGAAGTAHGALQAGALTTTFTASQGLLLMIPNMYKIAGELTPFCMHVAARTVATHALSIFADHSDVMAVRQTGFAMLASASVQEAHDLALIGHAATLASRIPFVHFFDGFRTSHEVNQVELLDDSIVRGLLDEQQIEDHRRRALTPDRPVLRGSAQNPDVFFQAREACNGFYLRCPAMVRDAFERFAALTGRRYRLFDYFGDPRAERLVVIMGSGGETAQRAVEWLQGQGEKVGVVQVRLYRPFAVEDFIGALPATVRAIAVLDRTKEPGGVGEPLYLDVVAALRQARDRGLSPTATEIRVVGGRYGLSSKEFTPAAVKAVLDELTAAEPKDGFTVGIMDDVTHLSLSIDPDFDLEPDDELRAVFYGLGADGTVSANKNSIKILGEETSRAGRFGGPEAARPGPARGTGSAPRALCAQGYFVYDSKKAGAVTVSHLRCGPRPIRAPWLIRSAGFVACHQWQFVDRYDLLEVAAPGAIVLINAPYPTDAVWDELPREMQGQILDKRLRLWVIDAYRVARDTGLGVRINTIMQTCFFALLEELGGQVGGALPQTEAIAAIKASIEASYGKRGQVVVRQNFAAVDATLANLHRVSLPAEVSSTRSRPPVVSVEAPDFVQRVTAVMLANKGDLLPVSAFPPDGTWPTSTARWEKRSIALEIPIWDSDICIQCNQCALVCPHAAIRSKVFAAELTSGAPETFRTTAYKAPDLRGLAYTIQVAPDDCTGCHLCVEVCPAKDRSNPRHKAIDMTEKLPHLAAERENYGFFLDLPEIGRERITRMDAKGSQFLEPLFEYSGACAGCGETPYIKLLTQLFGDRLLIANATGCSSIYGGNLPTTPFSVNRDGRGPAWSNSLFEDNAEFGLGFRLAVDSHQRQARMLLERLAGDVGDVLTQQILEAVPSSSEEAIAAQRDRVAALRARLASLDRAEARRLEILADYLVRKSVWLVGGDGWAYDIGYGGLEHVLALGRDVNVLVLDTEVYSNTGGQQSKATPLGASAKFAIAGKEFGKKDLGMELMSYGRVYVARIAFGAKMNQTVQALAEADAFPGPSLIIAYSHCIAHGYDMRHGAAQQQLAVDTGIWPLYRFDPRRARAGEAPLKLDSAAPSARVKTYLQNEGRFSMVEKMDPKRYKRFVQESQRQAEQRFGVYQQLAGVMIPQPVVPLEENGGETASKD